MATVTGFTAEHMQEIEDNTIVDGEVINEELVLVRHDGSTLNVGNVSSDFGGTNIVALRSFHRNMATSTGSPVDIVVCGDSISEGWTADGSDDYVGIHRIRKVAAALFNAGNSGRYGRFTAAGSSWFPRPKFSINGTGSTEQNHGLALRGRAMASTSPEAVLDPTVCDGISVNWFKINLFAAGDGTIRIMKLADNQRIDTTLSGTPDLATNPTTLGVASTANLTSSGFVLLRKLDGFSPAIIQYTGVSGGNTLTGVTCKSETSYTSGGTVEQCTQVSTTQVQGFDSTLAANVKRLQEFYSGALPRGRYTVGVAQKTRTGGFSGQFFWTSAYTYDGDRSAGVRVYNASHFGYNFSTYGTNADWTVGSGFLTPVVENYISPRLWVWTHGQNDGIDPAVLESRMRVAVQKVWDAQSVAGQLPCSQAVVVPYAGGSKTVAQWAPCRDIYYKVARDLNLAVWDWSEFMGPVSTATGDPIGWTAGDNLHLNAYGQRAFGDWLAGRIFEYVAPASGTWDTESKVEAVSAPIPDRKTASYTLVLSDKSKFIEMNSASANNLTVPLNSAVAFPIGTVVYISQYGAGLTTIAATGGVTLRSRGSLVNSNGQYSQMKLKKTGVDEWYLSGDLA